MFAAAATVFTIAIILFIYSNQVHGVKQYKTIYLGMDAVEKPGSKTIWAPPYNFIPEDTSFVVYALNDKNMCMESDCGMGGYFVDCLGGWITGYGTASGDVLDYGMEAAGINVSEEKYITIADKNGKVVGIYPGARIKNIPFIMRDHRNLVPTEIYDKCFEELPSRWK